MSIEEITSFAKGARALLDKRLSELYVPEEKTYVPGAAAVANVTLSP